jgi:hypothetical protein
MVLLHSAELATFEVKNKAIGSCLAYKCQLRLYHRRLIVLRQKGYFSGRDTDYLVAIPFSKQLGYAT